MVSGDVPVVNTLLARGAHVNGLDGHTLSPLYHAASRGDVAMVQALLGHQHIDLNVGRVTPLIGASIHGHVAVVNLLLGHGAPLNAVCRLDGEGVAFTALAGACAFGHMEVARALILHGVDLFWASTEVGTALEYARRRGYDQVADELTVSRTDRRQLTAHATGCEELSYQPPPPPPFLPRLYALRLFVQLLVNQLTLAKAAVLCGLSADKSGVLAEREREGGAAPAVELDEWGQLVLKGLAPDLQKEMADYLP